jgi:hypothetical protein
MKARNSVPKVEGGTVSNSARVPAKGKAPRPPRGRPNSAALLAVVNGALVGVGSVYLTTHSVLITLIAAAAAVMLATLAVIFS